MYKLHNFVDVTPGGRCVYVVTVVYKSTDIFNKEAFR
jgi:hypothetical protein